jgi:hypothetical protein
LRARVGRRQQWTEVSAQRLVGLPRRDASCDLKRIRVERLRQAVRLGPKRAAPQVLPHPVDLRADGDRLAALAIQQ